MRYRELKPNVLEIGSIDWDRRLFDELIPLPDGTSYNSYLIQGNEKTALIDTVDPDKKDEFIHNLQEAKVAHLDYIISNHAEQDHSGAIPQLLELHPEAQIVTNAKCQDMIQSMLLIPEEKIRIIEDGESISLGDKTLEFILTPWVHWPDTMLTYLKEDKILFSCDFLGSHLATSELFVQDETKVYSCAKRYYAEIMMPFRTIIKKHLERIDSLDLDLIAPSHGPVYTNPDFILNVYKEWVSDKVRNEVILPYVSMHGSTEKIVDYFIKALMKKGISVKPFNLTRADIGELAMALVDAATVIIASPTVLVGPHPAVVYATYLINALRPKTKFVSVIGSYGWGGKMLETITGMLSNLKAEFLDPVIIKGFPEKQDFESLHGLADCIVQKHKKLNIL